MITAQHAACVANGGPFEQGLPEERVFGELLLLASVEIRVAAVAVTTVVVVAAIAGSVRLGGDASAPKTVAAPGG
jgi:hypothetical protein